MVAVTPMGRVKLPSRFMPLRQGLTSSLYPITLQPPPPPMSHRRGRGAGASGAGGLSSKPVEVAISGHGLLIEPAVVRLGEGSGNTGYFTLTADEHDNDTEHFSEVCYELRGVGAADYIAPTSTPVSVLPRPKKQRVLT